MARNATRTASPAELKGYTPKLTDPRVRGRIKQALGWSLTCLNDDPREISKSWIDASFGQQQNILSRWLRCKLLTCTNGSYQWGEDSRCKQYVLNRAGVQELRLLLADGVHSKAPVEPDLELMLYAARRAHAHELETLTFSYNQNACARLWHPLQNMPKESKKVFWPEVGLPWNYDVVACAPTLIHQYAQRHGMEEYLFGIRNYLKNPRDLRTHVCKLVGWDPAIEEEYKRAKTLINAMFCGARLAASKKVALFRLLGNDRAVMKRLQDDARLAQLKDDVRICWRAIETSMVTFRSEKGRKLPLSSKRKWKLYFELERSVLNAVWHYVSARDARCFLEHDGWRTDKPIDVAALEVEIESITGFKIKVSSESVHDPIEDFVTNPGKEPLLVESSQLNGKEDNHPSIRSPIVLKVQMADFAVASDQGAAAWLAGSYFLGRRSGVGSGMCPRLRLTRCTRQRMGRS